MTKEKYKAIDAQLFLNDYPSDLFVEIFQIVSNRQDPLLAAICYNETENKLVVVPEPFTGIDWDDIVYVQRRLWNDEVTEFDYIFKEFLDRWGHSITQFRRKGIALD